MQTLIQLHISDSLREVSLKLKKTYKNAFKTLRQKDKLHLSIKEIINLHKEFNKEIHGYKKYQSNLRLNTDFE